jgi:hypothetical protein
MDKQHVVKYWQSHAYTVDCDWWIQIRCSPSWVCCCLYRICLLQYLVCVVHCEVSLAAHLVGNTLRDYQMPFFFFFQQQHRIYTTCCINVTFSSVSSLK